jgi:hypothetical protein
MFLVHLNFFQKMELSILERFLTIGDKEDMAFLR